MTSTGAISYRVSVDLALKGEGAPSTLVYEAALKEARAAFSALLEGAPLELLTNIERKDDLKAAAELAAAFSQDTSEIFVLGIGGSSLGGQALCDLLPRGQKRNPRVTFVDNPDPLSFEQMLAACDLKTTRFLAISKSGGTAETLVQTLVAAEAIEKACGRDTLKHHFAVVTEPKPSPLRKFGETIGCPVLDHPLGIGGRYSVLSMVGLLPAMLMGLDAARLREGARSVVAAARAGDDSGPVAGAALHSALARAGRLKEVVLWPYVDRLKTFGAWWRQLWAESLGKNGEGSTPVAALGPVDQHSQLQLFLDGPPGLLFTIISASTAGKGPVVPDGPARALGLGYLAGKPMGDLVDAEARATAETLARRGRPVRMIHVETVDEYVIGALFMHFMLETILMGRLMGVDPFDQPAVEEGKVLARAYLEGKKP